MSELINICERRGYHGSEVFAIRPALVCLAVVRSYDAGPCAGVLGGEVVHNNVKLTKGLGLMYDANGKVTEIPSGDVYWYAVKG